MSDTIHTVPVNDLIEHYSDGRDCPCGPEIVPIERDDGSIAFQLVHHALDGREHFEDGHDRSACPACIAEGRV